MTDEREDILGELKPPSKDIHTLSIPVLLISNNPTEVVRKPNFVAEAIFICCGMLNGPLIATYVYVDNADASFANLTNGPTHIYGNEF